MSDADDFVVAAAAAVAAAAGVPVDHDADDDVENVPAAGAAVDAADSQASSLACKGQHVETCAHARHTVVKSVSEASNKLSMARRNKHLHCNSCCIQP